MDSFEGSRRREGRPLQPTGERRPQREGEPLEQRLDRWMSTGRQLVEGVSGSRPGSRPTSRRSEGRVSGRGGFDGLGRWVEDRLDWLLDDSEDWPEPWQQSERRGPDPGVRPPGPSPQDRPRSVWSAAAARGRSEQPRRPLEAISRRSGTGQPGPAPTPAPPVTDHQEWPDDADFSVPRWQRPTAPLRRPDPLQEEAAQRRRPQPDEASPAPDSGARPLPRSSRRR